MEHDCPVCKSELESLYRSVNKRVKDYHYYCNECKLGFYIADLKGFCVMRLRGKTDEEVKDFALNKRI